MARMYSKKKGKSGSTRVINKKKKLWVRYTVKEVEQLVVKLFKSGSTTSQIGMILRDTYGIPSVTAITKRKINNILEKNSIKQEIPEDLIALIKKEINVAKHLENNKKDMHSKRGLQLTESKIKRLVKYYKSTDKLPRDWVYERDKAKLLIG